MCVPARVYVCEREREKEERVSERRCVRERKREEMCVGK